MKNNKISILGCGWLGLPLAMKLIEKGYEIKGSTTSKNKIEVLRNAGILPYQIKLEENEITGNIIDFLADTKLLIIDIPPKLRGINKENFVQKIKNLIPYIENSGLKKVVFVSSTSVYGDDFQFSEVTEEDKPNPNTESGIQLAAVEKMLLSNPCFQTTILRFGGLINEDRNPIKMLSGKVNLENPNAPVNLIHQTDCIGIICVLVHQMKNLNWQWNQIFNAVAPQHPTRKKYYTEKALQLNLTLPNFIENSESKGKIISNKKIITLLEYSFKKEI